MVVPGGAVVTIYIFDRDSAGQWGFTAIGDEGVVADRDGYELLADAMADAEYNAADRGEQFADLFSINSRKAVQS